MYSSSNWREKFITFKCKSSSKSLRGFSDFVEKLLHGKLNNRWRTLMKNAYNKSLPDLDRCEGGMGGDNNYHHKQLRYPASCPSSSMLLRIKLLNPRSSGNVWTDIEVYDLIESFVSMAKEFGVDFYCVWNGRRYFE